MKSSKYKLEKDKDNKYLEKQEHSIPNRISSMLWLTQTQNLNTETSWN